jgi:hypothetical protein
MVAVPALLQAFTNYPLMRGEKSWPTYMRKDARCPSGGTRCWRRSNDTWRRKSGSRIAAQRRLANDARAPASGVLPPQLRGCPHRPVRGKTLATEQGIAARPPTSIAVAREAP